MNKLELILFAILSVISVIVTFDFVVFIIKSAPKQSYLSKAMWKIGMLAIIILVYWYINGMKFFN